MRRTIEQLRNDFRYDPEAGTLFRARALRSDAVGFIKPGKRLRHYNHFYQMSHLVWALHYGVWPVLLVDHRDGDRSNIRINNFREATHQQNQFNKVGFGMYPKGVVFKGDAPRRKPWAAVIRINGRKRTLGHYETMEEAAARYEVAAERYQGEFALHNSMKDNSK